MHESSRVPDVPGAKPHSSRLALLLAAAMFVLVVDTSLMNVSISAVVEDLDTTVSGVQSAIALEALVSAACILFSSKVGDLIGRKKAYVLGLLGYAVGALAILTLHAEGFDGRLVAGGPGFLNRPLLLGSSRGHDVVVKAVPRCGFVGLGFEVEDVVHRVAQAHTLQGLNLLPRPPEPGPAQQMPRLPEVEFLRIQGFEDVRGHGAPRRG